MDRGGDRVGRKILPLGQGALELDLLRVIRDSGYRGPIRSILRPHTMDDAEQRLQDNLDGLDWLLPQLDGKPPGPRPKPRTPVPLAPATTGSTAPSDPNLVATLIGEARKDGDARRGAAVFASPKFACLSCHKVEAQGGSVGPDPDDRGILHQARGGSSNPSSGRSEGQGQVTRRSRWPQSTARSVKVTRRRTRRPSWCCATRRRGIGSGSPGLISKLSAPGAR